MTDMPGRGSTRPSIDKNQLGENSQIDFSYDQWRHACMRQLEQSYVAVCKENAQVS